MKSELLDKGRSVLVLIDFQERLVPNVHEYQSMLVRIDLLLSAAGLLHIPVLLTEQYPKGLGSTIEAIRNAIPHVHPLEKTTFSCLAASDFKEWLASFRRDQVILAGIETHICLAQTALIWCPRVPMSMLLRMPPRRAAAVGRADCAASSGSSGLTITTAEAVV